jgi:hypothetical protein
LNTDADPNTARREKGATMKKERPNPPHKQQQKVPFQTTKRKKHNL